MGRGYTGEVDPDSCGIVFDSLDSEVIGHTLDGHRIVMDSFVMTTDPLSTLNSAASTGYSRLEQAPGFEIDD